MEKINEVELKPAIERFYLDYAVAVITDRALPNASDGLKPVHRRTLFGANDLKIFSNASFRKSAALVGHVMGDYHPHGGCISGDTEFLLTDGTYKNIYDMYMEAIANPSVQFEIYSLDDNGDVVVSYLTHPRVGQRTNEIYKVTFSNGDTREFTANHPIALNNLSFKRVDELKIGDIVTSATLCQDEVNPGLLLSRYYNNRKNSYKFFELSRKLKEPIKKGCVVHHKDFNRQNNSTENLEVLTRAEHALVHKNYEEGLEKGRETMFSEEGEVREAIKKKNKEIFKIYNDNQAFFKARKIIRYLQDNDMELTNHNYTINKDVAYNAPTIDTLIEKGYITSSISEFSMNPEELPEKVRFDFSSATGLVPEKKPIKEKPSKYRTNDTNSLIFDIKKIIKYENKNKIPEDLKDIFNNLIKSVNIVCVDKIEVVNLPKKRDMYDFTVTGFENAMIKSNDNLLCIHNSAIYDATVILSQPFATRYPLFEGQGNFGNIDGDGAAAYRYCLIGDTLVKMADGSLIALKDIEQTHTEPGEFTELNDVYILNKDLEKKQATHFYNSGIQDTISVKTKNQTKPLVGTPNHPVIALCGNKLKWQTLDNIKIGDILVSPYFEDKEDIDENDLIIGNYTFDEVVSIEEAGKQQTYCLRVDCPSHSFIAGGFINHNTEIRLSPYGELMLDGINNNVVPMVENYDGEHLEPTVLPSKIPNMIINGSSGIAVAMSTNMPPHNLRETVNAIELVINNPEATTDDILSVMPGPDFPLGGIIRELDGIRDYYDTGRGKFAIESKWSFERVGRHNNIYFTEIPYGVNKSKIVQKIAELIDQEAYEGLMSVEDESNIKGIKIVVKADENVDIENLVQFLFKKTPLSNGFNAINLALDEKGKPKIYTMKELILTYINHQRMVYSNDAINNIKSLDKSIKIANALIKASSQIKKVVEIIEKSKDTETVRAKLKKLLDVDDESVTYILDLQLRRIQKIEKKKQEDDLKELEAKRAEYQKRLDEPDYLNKVIISDLKNIVNKIKDERRTLITNSKMSVKTTTQKFKILYSDNKLRVENLDYYVKKVDMEEIKGLIETDSGSVTLVIQKDGSAIAINNYTLVEKVKEIENISTVVSISYDTDDDNLYLFTKNGMVKAISLELLLDTIGKKDNFEVIGLESGDEVVAAFTDKENSSVIAYNNGGKFIRASLSDVRPMGLPAKGVMFMKLDKDVSVIDVNSTSDKSTLFYVKDGALSSVALDSINIQGRAGQGRMLFENKAAIPANFQNEIFISGDKVLVLK